MSDAERGRFRKTYLIEVGIEEVAGKPCVQAAVADKRAQVDDAVEERIATVEFKPYPHRRVRWHRASYWKGRNRNS